MKKDEMDEHDIFPEAVKIANKIGDVINDHIENSNIPEKHKFSLDMLICSAIMAITIKSQFHFTNKGTDFDEFAKHCIDGIYFVIDNIRRNDVH